MALKRKGDSSEIPSMSGDSEAVLHASVAREMLFDKILDQLAASSLFSNPTFAPTIFIVYAHDNEKEGTAYDGCVRKMISWLKKIHAQILSDQSALPLLQPRIEGTDAIRNILANQLCLLPPRTDDAGLPAMTSVSKVIVCGSEVLERYYNNPAALSYIGDIVELCNTGADQSTMALIRDRVETESRKDDFHHVLTELAFLEVRTSRVSEIHGMVPVVLNQINADEAPMQYLPSFYNTDVKLKLKSPETSSLHKLFFKLLEQLFPDDRDFIKPFRDCYDSVCSKLQLDGEAPARRREFDNIVSLRVTEAYQTFWSLFCVVLRDGKLQAYAGKLSGQVSQVLEMTSLSAQHQILKWLSPIAAPEQHGKYHDSGTSRMQGTCDWVIQDEKFCRWYAHKGSALLFLCGNMGTGKTHSTSRVVDWVEQGLSTNSNDEAFAYFYCNKQDPARRESKEILRNIIRQLATGPWKAAEKSGTIHKTVYNLWKKSQGQGISSTFAQWEACLLALIDTYPRTTIVLDALDECEKEQRRDLINLLVTLATRHSKDQPVKIFVSTRPEKDMLRHFDKYPAIRMQEKHNTDDIAIFVRTQIAEHHRWSKMSEQFRTDVIDTLLEKSGDMFLFASLQMEHLLLCKTEPALKARLAKLPDSLEKTYEEIYQRAASDPDERNLLDRAVRWVMCSARPLTTDELVLAISQDSDSDEVMPQRQDVDEELILELCHNLLCLDVLDVSHDGSIDDRLNDDEGKSQPVWRLAHQAVAEFFEGSICCNYDLAHFEVGKVCLMVLLDTFGRESARSRDGPDDVSETSEGYVCPCRKTSTPVTDPYMANDHLEMKNSLAEYAIYAWPTHVRAQEHRQAHSIARLSQILQQFLGEPEESSLIYDRWLEHTFHRHSLKSWSIFSWPMMPPTWEGEPKMNPISLACYLGFYTTLTKWWDLFNFDENGGFSVTTPYEWQPIRTIPSSCLFRPLKLSLVALACIHDEVKILQRLLDRGAHVNTIEEYELPPIVVTAGNDSVNSLEELLRRRTEMCSPFTRRYGHVVHFAIYSNSLKVLELLLDRFVAGPGEVEETLKEFRWTASMSADTITMLLDKGMDANVRLGEGSLLAAAVVTGAEDLVRRLLANGADVNAQWEVLGFRNALEASLSRHRGPSWPWDPAITYVLIEQGACVTARTVSLVCRWSEHLQPGHHSQSRKEEVLQLLLGHTPDLSEIWTDQFGSNTTALIEIVKSGEVREVRFLIKHGADVNQQVGGVYGDALNTAVWATFESAKNPDYRYPTAAVFEALVEEGASLETLEGDRLNTALVAAALAGSEDMVQLFLDHGANPNAFCKYKWATALSAAAQSWHPRAPDVVRTLLDGGADVNAYFPESINNDYKLALDYPLHQILQLLLMHQYKKWDSWLQLASVLLSNGAIWDIDFAQWRECLKLRASEFERRHAQSLDQSMQMLKRNRTSFFLKHPAAASDESWRFKGIEDPSSNTRSILRVMRFLSEFIHVK
ncbi:hypothetical protein J7T55_015297 [Diaporthe amygdali]|uniref:uncharacterized protein n=1 Tax=Phomopsis amygdali TaxID=1214568 RepID=UPI0022FDD4F2|nr:uncharacterized protein J7T55_015297 [Diaporthe amygdali]KAJ0120568.1 hypothetical protein J7T55_015297 [Diaporthe amygdali]